ncbi:polysaccharide deacetylase family protein [Myxococcus xanthus]|uniref:Polysaccharide deacetylase family protein n=1 Tax=Myxococcus xanthus TaxID=34 RepID=A0A7Y4II42_MYXXA|nr:polysaccharide deacetylase family protein [Myxococcus xanthus]NOJ79718.1 polysaccharide deacetylase family protein [Myxococcus xanthus]NOJ90087.1 polysaccharide deacetylase family protein [Myxococcus xanthus]
MRARLNARAGTCLLAMVLGVWSGGAWAEAPGARTVVTLAFDDGVEEQRQVLDMLSASGLKATFFIISGRVGQKGYLNLDDLRRMAAAGHDIGGHTLQHMDLVSLTRKNQRREICEDRLRLLSWGFSPTALAFPFGSNDVEVNQTAAACGYNAARDVRGLVDTCGSCPTAETIPPRNPYEIRTASTVTRHDRLEQMQAWVTTAEAAGGGWVIVVFHLVDPNCTGRTYCVKPDVLREFMGWLSQRAPMGTEVRTMQDILGGATRPAVHPVPLPPTATLKNPSLEDDENGDGVPDCWQLGPVHGGAVRAERSTEAHSGAWSYRLERVEASGGAASLQVLRDDGTCAPAVTPGSGSRVSVWYRASTPLHLEAAVKGADGTWKVWNRGPSLPPTETWTEASWELPIALPADAFELSVGVALEGVGWALVDDFGLADATAPAARLVLDAPAGGEDFVVGQDVEVKWSTLGEVRTLDVAYSTETSASWVPIATSVENTGHLIWRVPDAPSREALLRVASAEDETVSGISAPFRILPGAPQPGIVETPPEGARGDGQVNGESGGCGGCAGTGTGQLFLAVAGGLIALSRSRARRRQRKE